MIDTIVWDLGQVVIAWDRERLYSRLIPDPAQRRRFFDEVLTLDFNARIDLGLPLADGVAELTAKHPEWAIEIAAFDDCWDEIYPGPIPGTAEIITDAAALGLRQLVLSNFSTENFARVLSTGEYAVLDLIDVLVLSAEVGLVKPDPAIFELLVSQHKVNPERTVFIDDSLPNITAASALGFHTVHFTDAPTLLNELTAKGILPAR